MCTLFFIFNSFSTDTQKIKVHISEIQNVKGNIQLGVYANQEDFAEDKSLKLLVFPKEGIQDGQMDIILDLASGVYGLALLDDENGNGRLSSFISNSMGFIGFLLRGSNEWLISSHEEVAAFLTTQFGGLPDGCSGIVGE